MHYGIFTRQNDRETLVGTRYTAWEAHQRARELQDQGTPCYVDIIAPKALSEFEMTYSYVDRVLVPFHRHPPHLIPDLDKRRAPVIMQHPEPLRVPFEVPQRIKSKLRQ